LETVVDHEPATMASGLTPIAHGPVGACPSGGAGPGQTVLVLQGGGALGAYQAGVFEALEAGGLEPDWVIGTSIGAINAALIVGNAPGNRLHALKAFWERIRHNPAAQFAASLPWVGGAMTNALTVATGIQGFFEPNPWAFMGNETPLGCEHAAFYSTMPLHDTLRDLVDFDRINAGPTRLSVGAANVSTGEMKYFDSREMKLDVRHIMASGALPPAFPAVRIDGELYWDGGVLSNTPVEAVFDDNPRLDSLIFAVHIWNPQGMEPDTIQQVMSREKDLRYASRATSHIARQKQLHKLRHIITELFHNIGEDGRKDPAVRALAAYGCVTRMHVVRLLAPPLAGEDHSRDIDFSPASLECRWRSGREDTERVIARKPWDGDFDPMEGFILHEAAAGVMVNEG